MAPAENLEQRNNFLDVAQERERTEQMFRSFSLAPLYGWEPCLTRGIIDSFERYGKHLGHGFKISETRQMRQYKKDVIMSYFISQLTLTSIHSMVCSLEH